MVNMNTTRRWPGLLTAALGPVLAALTGCQTSIPNAAPVTLPSPPSLDHPPHYIPHSPFFPLPREEATMEATYARPVGGAAPAPLPPPVPNIPAPVPVPPPAPAPAPAPAPEKP